MTQTDEIAEAAKWFRYKAENAPHDSQEQEFYQIALARLEAPAPEDLERLCNDLIESTIDYDGTPITDDAEPRRWHSCGVLRGIVSTLRARSRRSEVTGERAELIAEHRRKCVCIPEVMQHRCLHCRTAAMLESDARLAAENAAKDAEIARLKDESRATDEHLQAVYIAVGHGPSSSKPVAAVVAEVVDAHAALTAERDEMREALIALRDACKANPAMQGREYIGLGIQVNNALSATPAPKAEPLASPDDAEPNFNLLKVEEWIENAVDVMTQYSRSWAGEFDKSTPTSLRNARALIQPEWSPVAALHALAKAEPLATVRAAIEALRIEKVRVYSEQVRNDTIDAVLALIDRAGQHGGRDDV